MKNPIICLFVYLIMATAAYAEATLPVTLDNGMNRPLGNGYDTRKQAIKAQCAEGRPSSDFPDEGQISQGDIRLRMEGDQSSTADKLGFSVGAKARIGLVKVSASADYLNESTSTGLSLA